MASALLCSASVCAPASAQDRAGAAAAAGADVSHLLQQADTELSELEQATTDIETSGVVPADTAQKYVDTLSAYAETMHEATDGALDAAGTAARTKGMSGNVSSLAAFEKTAKDHETRTALLGRRLAAISEKLHRGTVKSAAVGGVPGMAFAGPSVRAIFERLSKPLAAPAEAALAIPALNACVAKNWTQCAILIVTAVSAAKTAWSTYQSCQNNAPGVPSKPSPPSGSPWYSYAGRWAKYLVQLAAYTVAVINRAAYQANCVATFVAKIA